ncbi:hypothetical protein BCV71DRAFT_240091 [Rhizopus microsporus]|uniref:Uncharacterized protein n=1 Tax=Rhizopus microsporus TaxID=58291 RepID=A0A1X0RK63_RHIZD|nr:hypothetical protein BCV71DRAFT_240091 [Rhizopus microsporus]
MTAVNQYCGLSMSSHNQSSSSNRTPNSQLILEEVLRVSSERCSDQKKATRAIFCRATIYKKVEEKSKQCDAPENLDVVLHANVSSLEVTIRYLKSLQLYALQAVGKTLGSVCHFQKEMSG